MADRTSFSSLQGNSGNTHNLCSSVSVGSVHPDDELYIYYLKGRIKSEHLPSDNSFLGNWEEDGLSFLFFTRSMPRTIEHILNKQPELELLDEFHTDYEHWQGGAIHSFQMGGVNFVPLWERRTKAKAVNSIYFDPGVVFGTGNHGTTMDCLRALSCLREQVHVQSALDLGSGSGLLSLAAAAFGIGSVLALDLNPLAVLTTKRNICLNKMQNQIIAVQGKAEDFVHCRADLLIANIHYDVIQRIVQAPGFLCKQYFILSGLLASQADGLLKYLNGFPLDIFGIYSSVDGWRTIVGKVLKPR